MHSLCPSPKGISVPFSALFFPTLASCLPLWWVTSHRHAFSAPFHSGAQKAFGGWKFKTRLLCQMGADRASRLPCCVSLNYIYLHKLISKCKTVELGDQQGVRGVRYDILFWCRELWAVFHYQYLLQVHILIGCVFVLEKELKNLPIMWKNTKLGSWCDIFFVFVKYCTSSWLLMSPV